jgi:hypothetical protein
MGMLFEYAAPIGCVEDDLNDIKRLPDIETRRDEELAEARATQIIDELEELVKDIRSPRLMVSDHDVAVRLYHFIHNGCR